MPRPTNFWNITSPIYLNGTTTTFNGTINILQNGSLNMNSATMNFNGTLNVYAGGNLTLINSTMIIYYWGSITINQDGELYLKDLDGNPKTRQDESRIMASTKDARYYLEIRPQTLSSNSMIRIINSKIMGADFECEALLRYIITGNVFDYSDLFFIRMRNLNYSNNELIGSSQIIIFQSSNVIIENNIFENSRLTIAEHIWNFTIRNNTFYNISKNLGSALGISNSYNGIIANNTFTNNYSIIEVFDSDRLTKNIIIRGNRFYNTTGGIVERGTYTYVVSGMLIDGNYIKCGNYPYTVAFIAGFPGVASIPNPTIASNIVDSCYTAINGTATYFNSIISISNTTILNPLGYYFSIGSDYPPSPRGYVKIIVTNSTASPSKILFHQDYNKNDEVTYRGLLSTHVVDYYGKPIQNASLIVRDNGIIVKNLTTDANGWLRNSPITAWRRGPNATTWNKIEIEVSYKNYLFDRNPRPVNLSSGWVIETFRALPPLERIIVTPNYTEVINGSSIQFAAKGYDAEGNETSLNFTWKVNGTAGTISPNGLFTATRVGYATVEASGEFNGQKRVGYADVRVLPRLDHAIIFPSNVTLAVGENITFDVSGFDENGIPVENAAISWITGGNIGSVDQFGKFIADKAGFGYVTATMHQGNNIAETKADIYVVNKLISSVELKPAKPAIANGTTFKFTAIAYDKHGMQIDSPTLEWAVTGGIGTIQNGVFKATKTGIGKVLVIASYEGVLVKNETSVKVYEPPSLTIITPRNGATVSGIVDISGTSTGENGSVYIQIDNSVWMQVSGTAQWIFKWDTRSVSDGNHGITVKVIDGYGNEIKKTISVTVANNNYDFLVPVIFMSIFIAGAVIAVLSYRKKKKK